MKYPKLFDDQPEITPELLADFEKRGLITAVKTKRTRTRAPSKDGGRQAPTVINDVMNNPTAGNVVGYTHLAGRLHGGKISQLDARALLAIETATRLYPRESHVSRLLLRSFADDKDHVIGEMQSWAKKQK